MPQKDIITFAQFKDDIKKLAEEMYKKRWIPDEIIAVTRGGLCAAALLSQYLDVRVITTICLKSYDKNYTRGTIKELTHPIIDSSKRILFIDDLCDSGATVDWIRDNYCSDNVKMAVVYNKNNSYSFFFKPVKKEPGVWLEFPWEDEPLKRKDIEKRIFQELKKKYYKPGEGELQEEKEKEQVIRPIPLDKPYKGSEGFELSAEQKKVINWIENSRGRLTLLTGKAGSGKSTIIKNLLARNPDWAITATTGKAAVLINGCTIDKMFSYDRDTNNFRSEAAAHMNMNSCGKVIIVDEASMMGHNMFDFCYNLCKMHQKDLILVGDWGQASPVKDGWIFNSPAFMEEVQVVRLTESHRQNASEFLEVLDKIRNGIVDDQVNKMFTSRICKEIPEDDSCLILHSTNASVNAYNEQKVKELSEKSKEEIFILDCYVVASKPYITQERKEMALDSCMLARKEKLCLGCKVLITRNSQDCSYVNGDTGILMKRDAEGLSVLLDRNKQLVRVTEFLESIKDLDGNPEISIKGFPIKAGYALTIHKSQGMTIPKVYAFVEGLSAYNCHGLCYVAFSRVRQLEDLFISCWDPSVITCENITKQFL